MSSIVTKHSKLSRVIKAYSSPYTEPWKMSQGEMLNVGKRDSEWDGWIWCTYSEGESRWVPERYLQIMEDTGIALCDYESTELAVKFGDLLTLGKEESGWFWCTNVEGSSGWVPSGNLEIG